VNPFTPPAGAPEASSPADDVTLPRYRWLSALGFLVACLMRGAFAALDYKLGELVALLTVCSACAMWCVVDSMLRGKYWPRYWHWITFWAWPVAVPVYLVWSRGARGLLLAVVLWVALFALPWLGASGLRFAIELGLP